VEDIADAQTVSRFERGRHLPSLQTLERLAALLHTTAGELMAARPPEPEDDAVAISAWLKGLDPQDHQFLRNLLKQWCDYLTERKALTPHGPPAENP
jgi:transcriptional regulator with XRE-family HTH domain